MNTSPVIAITLVLTLLLSVCTLQVLAQRATFTVPHSWNPIVHVRYVIYMNSMHEISNGLTLSLCAQFPCKFYTIKV